MEEKDPEKGILLLGVDEEEQDMDVIHDELPRVMQPAEIDNNTVVTSATLIAQIITPSPFPDHNNSATADRYRSALQRVTTSPQSDVEAWQAVMTECVSLYKLQLLPELEKGRKINTNTMMFRNEEVEKKMDWVESCYGHLLSYFPYSSNYYVDAVDFLLARSSLPFESLTGGDDDFSFGVKIVLSDRQNLCESKIDRIFRVVLGAAMDSSGNFASDVNSVSSGNVENQELNGTGLLGGMCTSSVDLWLLYIRKRSRDAKRKALESHLIPPDSANPNPLSLKLTSTGEQLVRECIIGAYEVALKNGAAFANNNYLIWKQYLNYVKGWNLVPSSSAISPTEKAGMSIDHSLHSKQKQLLRSIYQRIITLPMLGLDSLWQAYEVFEKAQSEQLASALIAEHMPKYQHARSVYLERSRIYNINELKIGRLATPPVDFDFLKKDSQGNEGSAGVGIGGSVVVSSTGALPGAVNVSKTSETGDITEQEEFKAKIKEEAVLLAKWKRRCGYERSNPERLTTAELTIRVRQCYKDAICVLMRHIEVWHEWSTWELLKTGGGGSVASKNSSDSNGKKRSVHYSISVLELAQTHIPDSTLLAYTHAQTLEDLSSLFIDNIKLHGNDGTIIPGDAAIRVMQKFCNRAGNSLGYVLLQRLVRKYKGIRKAREIFSSARRNLCVRKDDVAFDDTTRNVLDSNKEVGTRNMLDEQAKTVETRQTHSNLSGRTIVNRTTNNSEEKAPEVSDKLKDSHRKDLIRSVGYITWHLYSGHATIEHRINGSPKIAARIYELGLRKHRSFLSTPQYILQYASLLLELHDEENLRALLTRAIAACEEVNCSSSSNVGECMKAREAQRPLWDMMLKFESNSSICTGDFSAVQSIEARRRKALYGPDCEDVANGDAAGMDGGDIGIGMHKSSLSDTLIRADGYDVSSRIVNGMNRLVDCLKITEILDQEANLALASITSMTIGAGWKDDGASGASDASFMQRKQFQTERFTQLSFGASPRGSHSSGFRATGTSTGKLLSAKDRLTQSTQNATLLATSPEWLRRLIFLLPATIRSHRGAKAPPHIIEMALTTLRDSTLPVARPEDVTPTSNQQIFNNTSVSNQAKRHRSYGGGDDSSDDENGTSHDGGFFRARQRARMMVTTPFDGESGSVKNESLTPSTLVQ